MTEEEITEMQKKYKVYETQMHVNTGTIWLFEGTMGRMATDMLIEGILMLGKNATKDYWGNYVPSRFEVEEGSKGSLSNCINYWKNIKEKEDNENEQK